MGYIPRTTGTYVPTINIVPHDDYIVEHPNIVCINPTEEVQDGIILDVSDSLAYDDLNNIIRNINTPFNQNRFNYDITPDEMDFTASPNHLISEPDLPQDAMEIVTKIRLGFRKGL